MIEWKTQHHTDLTTPDLYAILKLRNAVYIVELGRPLADTDGLDLSGDTYHITGTDVSTTQSDGSEPTKANEKNVVAYLRAHVNKNNNEVLIRRVVVAPSHRGRGLARELMEVAIAWCNQKGISKIKLPARIHLQKFYESLGFAVTSEKYFIRGPDVWHVDMVKNIGSVEESGA